MQQIEISEQRLLKAHTGKGISNDILDFVYSIESTSY